MEPEILIVDEVLAVGDVHFSASASASSMTSRAADAPCCLSLTTWRPSSGCAHPRCCSSAAGLFESETSVHRRRVLGGEARGGFAAAARTGDAQILSADLEDLDGRPLDSPSCSDPIVCRISFALPRRSPGTRVGIGVLGVDGTTVFTTNNADAATPCPSGPGEFDACVTIPPNTLLAGEFHLALCLWNAAAILDLQEPALSFSVEPGGSALYAENATRKGYVHVDCPWSVAPRIETPAAVLT